MRAAGVASFFREGGSDGPIWLEISGVQESGHGARDFVYKVDSLRSLQRSYDRQRSVGVALPEIEFFYLPDGDHFTAYERPDVQRRTLAFLERCERAAAH